MISLMSFLMGHPDGTLDEMAAHIYNEGGELFSNQLISKRLTELQITKKRASTEAYQAQREDVQFRVEFFQLSPSPWYLQCAPPEACRL